MAFSIMVVVGLVIFRRAITGFLLAVYLLAALSHPEAGLAVPLLTRPIVVEERHVPFDGQPVAVSLYRPTRGGPHTGIILVPGLVRDARHDPRLVSFARALARCGFAVLVPELAGASALRLDWQDVERLQAAFVHARSAWGDAVHPDHLGLMGISLGGSYALVTAAQDGVRDEAAFVFSFGGAYHLPSVLRAYFNDRHFYAGRVLAWEPEAYSRFIVFYNHPRYAGLEEQTQAELESLLDRLAANDVDGAYRLAAASSRPAFFTALLDGGDPEIAAVVGRLVSDNHTQLERMSPSRWVAHIRAPVYILHATDDNVVPYTESLKLAEALAAAGHPPARTVLTALFSHVGLALSGVEGVTPAQRAFWTGYRSPEPLGGVHPERSRGTQDRRSQPSLPEAWRVLRLVEGLMEWR